MEKLEKQPDSPRRRRRLVDLDVKTRFVSTLRGGSPREEAAAAVGFSLPTLYRARSRDTLFRLAWEWAVDLHALYALQAERPVFDDEEAEVRITPCNRRPLQRRQMSWVRFSESRQQLFLNHFAATADAEASAKRAGVSLSTVNAHRRGHFEFDAAWHEALAHAVALLEAEAVRQRLEVQRRLTGNLHPEGELAQEFERVMKLLARWDRKAGGTGSSTRPPLERDAWTFDRAIVELERRLTALGFIKPGEGPNPPAAAR